MTAEGAVQETTPDDKSQPPAAKKKIRKKQQSAEEIKAELVSVHGDALSQLDKNRNIEDVKKEHCCSILWVLFGKYYPQSAKVSDLRKELTDPMADNPDWRQRSGPVAPPLPTGTATT